MEISKLIRKYREKARLTQKEVAERLHMEHNSYSQYETGKRRIETEMFFKIAEVLGINVAIRDKYAKEEIDVESIANDIKIFSFSFDESEEGIIFQLMFFIGSDGFILYTGENGLMIDHMSNLLIGLGYEEVKKVFKIYGEKFEPTMTSTTCPFCGKYKVRDGEMDSMDSHLCETLSNSNEFVGKLLQKLLKPTDDKKTNLKIMKRDAESFSKYFEHYLKMRKENENE